MWERNKILGQFNEVLVSSFLESKGHKILKLRFKRAFGEIDIISNLGLKIVFTEVKYRRKFEDFEGIIDEKKCQRLYKTAQQFTKVSTTLFQFDAIFIDNKKEIYHIENIL